MLTASSSPVRCLGCELLGRLAQGESFAPTGLRAGASAALLGAMRDPCTSVSAAAARGLRAAAGSEGGLGLVVVPELGELCRSNSSAAFRLRGLQLAVDIAALSEEAAASVASLGALNALVEGLRGREKDELGWLAAVEVAVDLARGNPLGAAAVLGPLGEQMLGAGTSGLGARALGALAEVSASAAAHPGGWAAAAAASTGEGGNSLLEGVLGCFGRALSAGDPTEKEAALGALAGFGATSAGSELLLGCPAGEPLVRAAAHAALHRDAHAPARLASLHAMAALAGAERVAFGGRIDLTGGPLGEAAEKHLRRAVYEAAAGDASPCTPAEALHRLVAQPLTEARVAAYRFVSALAARPWGAQEVLSNAGLFEDLLGRSRLDSAREVSPLPPSSYSPPPVPRPRTPFPEEWHYYISSAGKDAAEIPALQPSLPLYYRLLTPLPPHRLPRAGMRVATHVRGGPLRTAGSRRAPSGCRRPPPAPRGACSRALCCRRHRGGRRGGWLPGGRGWLMPGP